MHLPDAGQRGSDMFLGSARFGIVVIQKMVTVVCSRDKRVCVCACVRACVCVCVCAC